MRITRKKLIQMAHAIKLTDREAGNKLALLGQLINEPNVGHIVPEGKGLIQWLKRNGLEPHLNQEDHSDWWTVSISIRR